MFWWRKKWLDELSDSDESPFLECRHLLFEGESDYPICPSCGKLIKENLPQNSVDRSRLYLIYQKVKRLWIMKWKLIIITLIAFISYSFPIDFSNWLLRNGDYGFRDFFPITPHTPLVSEFTYIAYLPLFIFFFTGERSRRFTSFSLGFVRFHKIIYSLPVQLAFFLAVFAGINQVMPGVYKVIGDNYISKYDYLTPAQHAKGVELFIFVNMLSIWIVSGSLLIYQLIDRRRTWWLKEANEVYLSGGC